MISADDRFATAFDARVASDGDKLLIVRDNEAFEVNELGARIWRSIDTATPAEITDQLDKLYDVGESELRSDIYDFLAQMLDLNLIERL